MIQISETPCGEPFFGMSEPVVHLSFRCVAFDAIFDVMTWQRIKKKTHGIAHNRVFYMCELFYHRLENPQNFMGRVHVTLSIRRSKADTGITLL